MLLRIFDVVDKIQPCKASQKRKGYGICIMLLSEIRKSIIAPKGLTYGMSTNLPWHRPKWKSAYHRIQSQNDEVGVIKRSWGRIH